MKSEAKIVILVPTESEIGVFRRRMPRVDVRLTGVGPYRCAAVTAAVCAERPDWIVLAGIAGCYPESGEKVGECVLVETERTADVGSFSEGGVYRQVRRTVWVPVCREVQSLAACCEQQRECGRFTFCQA